MKKKKKKEMFNNCLSGSYFVNKFAHEKYAYKVCSSMFRHEVCFDNISYVAADFTGADSLSLEIHWRHQNNVEIDQASVPDRKSHKHPNSVVVLDGLYRASNDSSTLHSIYWKGMCRHFDQETRQIKLMCIGVHIKKDDLA